MLLCSAELLGPATRHAPRQGLKACGKQASRQPVLVIELTGCRLYYTDKGSNMRDFLLSIIAGSLLAMSITVVITLEDINDSIQQINVDDGDADDDELITWREPYGGCDEAYLYPKSPGYAECQEHGLIP